MFDSETQRHLSAERTQVPEEQPQARQHREAARRKPMRGQLQKHKPTDRGSSPYQSPTGTRQRVVAGNTKKKRPGRSGDGAGDEQAPGAPGIDQHSSRDLHGDIEVEVEGRQVAQTLSANSEGTHEFPRHDSRGNALVEAGEIEGRGDPPDGPRQPSGWTLGRGHSTSNRHESRLD